MKEFGLKSEKAGLNTLVIKVQESHLILTQPELIEQSLIMGEGALAHNGALTVNTGEFTGRSPKDRFIVEDEITRDKVWWGNINIPISEEKFDQIYNKIIGYLNEKKVFIRVEILLFY